MDALSHESLPAIPPTLARLATPVFTVIIPCFNAERTIGEAIESVRAQTEANFEILVVDDGSTDGSRAIVAAFCDGDSRIHLIEQPNSGPAAARNRGVERARGEFVAFLDADDRWVPTLLERHRYRLLADPKVGVSFACVQFYDPAMAVAGRVSGYIESLTLAEVLGENPTCTTSNVVVRRAVFDQAGGFNVAMTHAEDQEWIARVLASTTWTARGIDEVLVHYRTSTGGLSADLDRMLRGWLEMVERIRALAPAEVAEAEPSARALFERYLARRALRTGQSSRAALTHMARAFRHGPMVLMKNGPARTVLTVAGSLAAMVLPAAITKHALAR